MAKLQQDSPTFPGSQERTKVHALEHVTVKGSIESVEVLSFSENTVKNKNAQCWTIEENTEPLAVLSCSWFLFTLSISGVTLTGVALWHCSLYWSCEAGCKTVWSYAKRCAPITRNRLEGMPRGYRAFMSIAK